jgi:membrane-associated protein
VPVSHYVALYGPPVVFIVVFVEVFGLPFFPGELALVTAAALAQSGDLTLQSVLGSATTAAILGQATAYGLGRWRGRQILGWRFLARIGGKPLDATEAFFGRHGGKAVFLCRFVPLLRSTIGWMAGLSNMSWWRYLLWNVSGAIAWSLAVGLPAYFFGKAIVEAAQTWATIALVVVAAVALLVYLAVRRWRRRGVDPGVASEQEVGVPP